MKYFQNQIISTKKSATLFHTTISATPSVKLQKVQKPLTYQKNIPEMNEMCRWDIKKWKSY